MSKLMKKNTCKLLVLIFTLTMIISSSCTFIFAADMVSSSETVNRPEIISLTKNTGGQFTVKASTTGDISGYQVAYSLSSSFKSKKTKSYTTTLDLNKSITGLKWGKTYYVKVRAFLLKNSKKYYSKYSETKKIKTNNYMLAYTKNAYTYAHPGNKTAKTVPIRYKAECKVYSSIKSSNKGAWKKFKYDNKTYYLWVPAKTTPFTTNGIDFSKYTGIQMSQYQKEVIDKLIYIYKNWSTRYDYEKTYSNGTKDSNGKYPFDCSGLAKYVINTVMQQHVPSYRIPWNLTDLYNTEFICYDEYDHDYYATTVCSGKPDFTKLKPGDLVFFQEVSSKVDHVGIYLGNKEFMHSTKMTNGVSIMPLESGKGKFYSRFRKAKRVLP